MSSKNHPVYLIGSGPGDPELLTVKAHRLLQQADVVVYDRLVSDEILEIAPGSAMRIFAGKAARNHHMPQQEINDLLVYLAGEYKAVVRLKGGDPFVFGRGSEEALYLAEHGKSFEIVPGITAAGGCSAYAGIPLTHRGLSRSVQFVTGHSMQGRSVDEDLNWKSLSDPCTTLVIFMGLTNAALIARRLIEAGRPADNPVAIIERGTTPQQVVIRSTLAGLPDAIRANDIGSPALFLIGDVVSLADKLNWYQPDAR